MKKIISVALAIVMVMLTTSMVLSEDDSDDCEIPRIPDFFNGTWGTDASWNMAEVDVAAAQAVEEYLTET